MYQDPLAHLHHLNSPTTEAFIEQASNAVRTRFGNDVAFDALVAEITAQLQDEQQIPLCQEHRGQMYHFHQSPQYPKGVYRVCSAASYRAGWPDWRVLFSVADFDALLGADVYLDGVSHCVVQPERVLLSLSVAGVDEAHTLEYDLATAQAVVHGFCLPAGKNHIAWRDADSVWVCPAWDATQQTTSGYPRQVWLWQRGQRFEQAQCVYEMAADGVMVHAWRYLDAQGTPIDMIEAADGFFSKQYFQVDGKGRAIALSLPRDCDVVGYLAGQVLVHLKSDWQRSHTRYRAGSVLAVGLSRGCLGAAHVVFVPNATQVLESIETTKNFIVANVLDGVAGCLWAWRWQQGQWIQHTVPKMPGGALELVDQPWGGDVLHCVSSDFVTPLTLFSLDLNVMELTVLRRQPDQFDVAGIRVQQWHAVSEDGTRVPYYWVGSQESADTPTWVYAYGGFGVAELPYYLGTVGRHWLAQGKSFVLANVRGGGEFVHWHEAAQCDNKHKSAQDVLAVVHDIHQRGLSQPQHTAIQGGSNGGLVMAMAYVCEPSSVGALVCEVPLTDMLVYPHLAAGASWLEEYGDPDEPTMNAYWQRHSPYQQLREGVAYPPALITTQRRDDRVHPAHALKFYAKLHALRPQNTWLYVSDLGGHAGNSTQMQTATDLAYVLRFLSETVG